MIATVRDKLPEPLRGPLLFVATAIACALSAWVGTCVFVSPLGIAPIWPAAGVALAIACRVPRPSWGWVSLGVGLAAIVASFVAASSSASSSLAATLFHALAAALVAIAGATILTKHGKQRADFSTLGQLMRLLLVAGPVVAAAACVAAIPAQWGGVAPEFGQVARRWAGAAGLGMLLVAPALLSPPWMLRQGRRSVAEVCGLLFAVALFTWWLAAVGPSSRLFILNRTFAVTLPFLIWAALRTDVLVTTLVCLILSTCIVVETARGRGPMAATEFPMPQVMTAMQLVVAAWATSALLIAIVISERRQALQSVLQEEERFRLLAAGLPVGVFRTDAAGQCVYMNDRWRDITGQPAGQALGQGWAEALHPDDLDRVVREWQAAVDAATEYQTEYRVRRHFGEVRWLRAHVAPLRSPAGAVLGHVGIVEDVTDHRRTEALLLESEKMRTVAGLAAGMAHEINNPLAGMLQNAQVVLNRLSPDLPANQLAAEQAGVSLERVNAYMAARGIPDMLQSIRASGQRAADIVANMLSFSRAHDSSQAGLCILAELVDQTVELARGDFDLKKQYDFRSIELVREHAPVVPGVPCRAGEIQQVILNLLKNAAEAVAGQPDDARPRPPRIVLRTRAQGKAAVLEVEDNGVGVPDSARQRMFEPFFTTKGSHNGTGLGLFVSYFIVTRNHGGTIEVDSQVGAGTRFTVRLPLQDD